VTEEHGNVHLGIKTNETRTGAATGMVNATEVIGNVNENVTVTVTEIVTGTGEMMSGKTAMAIEQVYHRAFLLQCPMTGRSQLDLTLGITGTVSVKMDWARDEDPPMMM
jgi:hypothetical protein